MTYQEDPNMPRRPAMRDETSYTSWVLGALAVLLIAGAVMFMVNKDDGTQTANTPNKPSATAPANPPPPASPTTTGSGATAPANR
jgi:hypothetical protein